MRLPSKAFFTASSPVDVPGFRLNGIGFRERMGASIVDRPGGTGDYLLMFFHGEVRVGTSVGCVDCPRGTVVVWEPEDAHYYGNTKTAWTHSWLHVQGKRVAQWLEGSGLRTNYPMLCLRERFEGHLWQILHETDSGQAVDAVIVGNLLENMFRDLSRMGGVESAPVPAVLLKVQRYIEQNFSDDICLGFLADMAHLSPSHFSAVFKEHFKTSPIEYLIGVRLGQAAYLLRDRNLSITEIAVRSGYGDLYHFSKQFRKRYGVSPSLRRRSLFG